MRTIFLYQAMCYMLKTDTLFQKLDCRCALYILKRTQISYGQVDHCKYVAHICYYAGPIQSVEQTSNLPPYTLQYLPKRVYIEFNNTSKICRRNFKVECGFCSHTCFIVPIYTNMAWDPAEVDYFTLIGKIIISIQYIQEY